MWLLKIYILYLLLRLQKEVEYIEYLYDVYIYIWS